MTRILDSFLDHITTYRLVLYYLIGLLVAAFVLAAAGMVPHSPMAIALSTALALAASWCTNRVFAWAFDVPANSESVYITALILVLIVDPVNIGDVSSIGALVFASVWAMASKFIFAIGGKHLFNPAAIGVLLPALLLNSPATWWVGGNLPLLPFTVLGGVLVVRKLRRFDLVVTFMLVAAGTTLATIAPPQYSEALKQTLLYSPLFFFAFVMLTEPLTAPTLRVPRLIFAALVGFLFAPNVHIASFYFTPELALVIGNLFAWLVSPKHRLALTLERIEQSAVDSYDFIFSSRRRLAFQAGQYLEWTLGLARADSRGNRRYFTIASAPTENEIRLGVKFYPEASAFKRRLSGMAPGDTIYAAQLAGEFTLPVDTNQKLAFLAGGIGITPFRSMLQYLVDRGEARPIVVLYGSDTEEDIAYLDVLRAARNELGVRTVHAVAKGARKGQYPGFIDAYLVSHAIPDFRERTFYVSGPQAMVKAVRRMLIGLGVHRARIKVDFFPGLS